MSELANWMFQWSLSWAGLLHLVAVGVMAGAAIRLSPTRSVRRLWLVAMTLWVVAALAGLSTSPTPRAAFAGALWALSIIGINALFLGLLVARARPPRTILWLSAALLILQTPLSLLSGLYLTCYVGHDCP